jgi:hypothetical protein
MKRGMSVVLLVLLVSSAAWGADWYRYRGTLSENWRGVTGDVMRYPAEAYVLFSYDTTPWSISIEDLNGNVWFSGEFDQYGQKLQFRASRPAGEETFVGRGSFNAKLTTLNLQGWSFLRWPLGRSSFGQHRFRGQFVDIISR